MKTLKNLYYDLTIGRKWKRLNYELAIEDAKEFERALYMASLQINVDKRANKYANKVLKRAARAL